MTRTQNRRIRTAIAPLLALCLVAACDPATNPADPGEALWTLHGAVSSTGELTPEGDLRVAFLWILDAQEGGVAAVAQDLAVQPEFPLSFTLELFDAPPADAIWDGSELEDEFAGTRLASGAVVLYEDGDGDGELDLMPEDATEFVDTVLASSVDWSEDAPDGGRSSVMVLYLEGDEPFVLTAEEMTLELQPGLNLITAGFDEGLVNLGLDAVIELTMRDSPWIRSLACEQGVPGGGAVGNIAVYTPDMVDMVPADAVGPTCYPGDRLVTWEGGCEAHQEGVCAPIEEECTQYQIQLGADETPPENWPCPV